MTTSRPAPPDTEDDPGVPDDDADKAFDRRLLLARLATEFGPMVLFVGVYSLAGFAWATAAFMLGAIASVTSSAMRTRRIPVIPLVSTLIVLVLGGMTLVYGDALYVQLRPTISNSIFVISLVGARISDRNLLKESLSDTLSLSDGAWRTLLWRTILFLAFLAASNEIARHLLSVEMWVWFKACFVIPADLLFVLLQWRFARADQVRQRS